MHFKSDGLLYSNDFYAENGIKHYIPMFSFVIRKDFKYIENIEDFKYDYYDLRNHIEKYSTYPEKHNVGDVGTKLYIKALRGKGSIPNICFISEQLKISNVIRVNLYCKIVKDVNHCIWFDLFVHNIEYLENI